MRTSILVFGLQAPLPGCFNEVAWDFGYGQPFDKAVRNEMFGSCQPDYIAGISLLGGEPFEPESQRELLPFVRNFRALYPNKEASSAIPATPGAADRQCSLPAPAVRSPMSC